MKIKFHYSILGIFLAFIYTGYLLEFLIFIAIIIAHEFGHYFACILFKQKISSLNVTIVGGILDVEVRRVLLYQELIIYSSGILVNLIFLALSRYIPNEYYRTLIYNYNKLLILFNLIPVYPLDGYRIIESCFGLLNNPFREQRLLNYMSFSFLIFLSLYTILYASNITFWVVISYLIYHNFLLASNRKQMALKKIVSRYQHL